MIGSIKRIKLNFYEIRNNSNLYNQVQIVKLIEMKYSSFLFHAYTMPAGAFYAFSFLTFTFASCPQVYSYLPTTRFEVADATFQGV